MPKYNSHFDVPLNREIGNYLRECRETTGLSQDGLAQRGKEIGVDFDHSWISLWERQGPRPSFVKSQVYLQLIQADLGVVNDMIRARVEFVEPAGLSVPAAIARCRALIGDGRPSPALGVVVQALRDHADGSAAELASLLLTGSIVARCTDLLFLARHYVQRAAAAGSTAGLSASLAAKIAIERATLAIHHGDLALAAQSLERINGAALRDDPLLAADVEQARSRLANALGDVRAALRHLTNSQTLVGPRADTDRTAQLLACISFHQAELDQRAIAAKTAGEAVALVDGGRNRLTRLEVFHSAAKTYTRVGSYDRARELLAQAERLARDTARPLRLFAVHLAMLDLALRSSDQPLTRLMRRRLYRDRQVLMLTPRLESEYVELAQSH